MVSIRDLLLLYPRGGIKWLLRDEFSDTRAAGAVNGTPATPGPGTRKARDVEGKLSLAGGVAVWEAQDTPAWGDEDLVYADVPITRVAGRILLGKVNWTTANNTYGLAVVTTTTPVWPTNVETSISPYIGFFYVMIGASIPTLPLAGATDYILAIVLRAAGAYYFVKGGIYTNWTLIWSTSYGWTETLYAGQANFNGAWTDDYVRAPDALWLPTPSAYDTFNRGDGALGTSEATGPDGQGTPARTWVNRVGTTLVAASKAQASVLDGGVAIATVDTGIVNAVTDAILARAGNEVGIVLRYKDADNYIRAIHDGTNCKLIKRVAAAETDVISAVVALGGGAIRVIPNGTSFTLYLNNVKIGNTSTISDAALQTGTEQGLFSTNVGNTQNDFLVMPLAGSAYAALNKWSK